MKVDVSALPSVAVMLPHRPPMVLIDAVVAYEGDTITCRRTIAADEPYVEEGGVVPAAVAIEYIAQAVAVQRGVDGWLRGLPVSKGVLAAARALELHVDALAVGDELTIRAQALGQMAHIASFRGVVERRGEVVAEAQIQVAEVGDELFAGAQAPPEER
ncbi:MAG: hypothetical protein H6710_05060 [Myxococcales bacterium]|nr:hypothetical protein [Myxococcales bacterium]